MGGVGDPGQSREYPVDDQKHLLASLFQQSTLGFLWVDHKGIIRAANPRAQKLFDPHDENGVELEGLTLSDLDKKLPQGLEQSLSSLLTSTNEGDDADFTFQVGKRYLRARMEKTPTADDPALLTVEDVTDYQELDRRYQHAQKMETVGRLTGGIAHDFNNLLTGIMGNIELGNLKVEKGHFPKDELASIERIVERASLLTLQLLSFGRKQAANPQQMQLNSVLKEMEQILRRTLRENIEFITAPGKDVWTIMADPIQIGQILMNLVINARDAMPDGGRLMISTRNEDLTRHSRRIDPLLLPGKYAVLVVQDNGIGMDPEQCKQIFEPFFTTKAEGKGTGLGLSTVHAIVTQAKGRITVDSKPDEGTAFTLYFPRCREETDTEEQKARVEEETKIGGNESILIVEDDRIVADTMRVALSIYGYTVMAMTDPHLALSYSVVKEHKLDMIVVDMVMPSMWGDELVHRVRMARPDMPALFISAHREDQLRENRRLSKGDHFLQKPFSPTTLARTVRQLLDKQPKETPESR